MSCPNDDLAESCNDCTCKYKVVAVIPCFGRFPLLRVTVDRLYKVNGVHKVVLVGHEHNVIEIAKQTGSKFVHHENKPLGRKWNAGFKAAKELNPDAVLFVGSSDWISANWLPKSLKYLNEYEMIGRLDCHLLDIDTNTGKRLVYWPGYGKGLREEEPIGIGRVISARILDKIGWEPFDPLKDNSMDWQMWHAVLQNGGKVKLMNDDTKSLSISTNKWENKHNFSEHWNGKLPSQKITDIDGFLNNFPEAKTLFQ